MGNVEIDLFALWEKAMYRTTDPETSRVAAQEYITSGKLGKRQNQVLAALRYSPGSTHGELARALLNAGMNVLAAAESPHKRLPELERMGLVHTEGTRKCRETGNVCRLWWAK